MCRNHRGFIDAIVATAKVGADILLLNTAFAGPQLVDVLEREGPQVVIHDEEFTGLLAKADIDTRLLGWVDDESALDDDVTSIEALIPSYDDSDLDATRAPRAHRDPHLRHHRRTQGRAAQRGRRRRRGLPAVADAAALRLAHPHRRAAVPHLGIRPPRAVDAARLDRRAAPEVRSRGVPRRRSPTSAATRWS